MAVDNDSGLRLAFRLLQLTAPCLQAALPTLTHVSDEVGYATGFKPMLQLPDSTGILLGESFACYVRLINVSDVALSTVSVKCELQTDRQRLILHNSSSKPLRTLGPGASHDFLLRHDVKEPLDHLLTCSASYSAPDGSMQSEQQTMTFAVSNPLSVRTKTRTVEGAVFLEVCVENTSSQSPVFLEYVRLEPPAGSGPVEHLSSTVAGGSGPSSRTSTTGDAADILLRHIDTLQIIAANGALNLLYRLKAPSASSSKAADGKTDLGRLEIKWRRSMGEAGRLQTQHITLSSAAQPAIKMQLSNLPRAVQLEQPFTVALTLRNNTDRRLGPLQASFDGLSAGAGASFFVQGLQEAAVEELAPHASVTVPMTLLPIVPGVHSLSDLSLVEGSGKPLAILEATDIFVETAETL